MNDEEQREVNILNSQKLKVKIFSALSEKAVRSWREIFHYIDCEFCTHMLIFIWFSMFLFSLCCINNFLCINDLCCSYLPLLWAVSSFMSGSPYNKYDSTTLWYDSTTLWYDSTTLWYNIIVWQYNTMTLLFRYDDSVSSTLTLSENSSQGGSETCFLSDQSWIIMKDIWSSYMHIYWLYHDYIAYNTSFRLLWC